MPRRLGIGVVVVAVGLIAVFAGAFGGGMVSVVGADDTGPLADAGLDQVATEGSTVYLDAGGSTAPDSTIQTYEWEIETPEGATIEPDCPDCVQTSFVPNDSGTYAVSVTVTDDEEQTDTDTLYVEVEEYEPPEVTVEGPETVLVGEERTYTAKATATEEPLSSILWEHNESYHTEHSWSGEYSVTHETNITFTEPGVHEINATVSDELGYQASDGLTVQATVPEPYFAVSITDIDSPVPEGEVLTVTATVENTGEADTTQSILLTRDDSTVETQEGLSLAPGEQEELEFTWETGPGDSGTYEFVAESANESDSEEGTVEEFAVGQECTEGDVSDCLTLMSDFDADLVELDDGGYALDIELAPHEEWDTTNDAIELDPADHDVVFVTDDGEEIEVDESGEIHGDIGETGGSVELSIEEEERDDRRINWGADTTDEFDTEVEAPEEGDRFDEAGDADVEIPGSEPNGSTDSSSSSNDSGSSSGGNSNDRSHSIGSPQNPHNHPPGGSSGSSGSGSSSDSGSSDSSTSPSNGTTNNPVFY